MSEVQGNDPGSNGSNGSNASDPSQSDGHDAVGSSLVDAVMSGFVASRETTHTDLEPMLISNDSGHTMERAIKDELGSSRSFDMSVAFISRDALFRLKQYFLDFSGSNPSGSGRIFTSTLNYFNSPDVFKELLQLQATTNITVWVWQSISAQHVEQTITSYRYHPKGYVFRHDSDGAKPLYSAYVGSSNLTTNALNTNREWNLRVSTLEQGGLYHQLSNEIDAQLEESVPLTGDWLAEYERDFQRHPQLPQIPTRIDPHSPIVPNAMQREALRNLAELRAKGETRAIIISATGTGKTHLSAFDVQRCRPKRMLYIAQQQQILDAARASYIQVLGCPDSDTGLVTGAQRDDDKRYTFATVQTLSRPDVLSRFDPNAFDYILVDEVHHAAADSYRRIIDHFRPDFMLGMSATPERTDGINIFQLFGNNVAYEIRLQRALEEDMLCPFHYYGVAEYLTEDEKQSPKVHRIGTADGDASDSSSRHHLEEWLEQLSNPHRVRYIIDKIQVYGEASSTVCGLVFCSRRDEAARLSQMFNQQWNQQAERLYRTQAVTGETPAAQRSVAVERLERGELDYIFTVDLFNEGIDIPRVNQIVMLRQTQSSIIFTQQLGRGLRKFPGKDCVVVIDFIGNYANNYLIPLALYGNTGDRDTARKNLTHEALGVSSISFDAIARSRVLESLDQADLSDMRKLTEQYRQLRFQLGRIPMLMDVAQRDRSLVVTVATKDDSYLKFVRSRERSLSRGDRDFVRSDEPDALAETTDSENGILKMLTATQLRGLRPHELLILAALCGIRSAWNVLDSGGVGSDGAGGLAAQTGMSVSELQRLVTERFPNADASTAQCLSAFRVLDLSYFLGANRKRFGETPLVQLVDGGPASDDETSAAGGARYKVSDALRDMLDSNATFSRFFADTVTAGLLNCASLYGQAAAQNDHLVRGFMYGEKYSVFDVMRLCGWSNEQVAQNVGGYRLDVESRTLPIFIKYETSQYADRFLNAREIEWFSKNGRSLRSNEFQWLLDTGEYQEQDGSGNRDWATDHVVPVFVRRKVEHKELGYYFVGNVAAIHDSRTDENVNPESGARSKVVISRLELDRVVDPELYRHLTGKTTL